MNCPSRRQRPVPEQGSGLHHDALGHAVEVFRFHHALPHDAAHGTADSRLHLRAGSIGPVHFQVSFQRGDRLANDATEQRLVIDAAVRGGTAA
jgi:hypothetical protein